MTRSEAPTRRLANDAWESLFRAQAQVARELAESDVWSEVAPSEYGVLYALSTSTAGKRITELRDDVLLTQTGLSRLFARLEARGLVERDPDPDDGRASRMRLTDAGRRLQRQVGSAHAREVTRAMTRTLTGAQLQALNDLCAALVADVPARDAGAPAATG